MSRREETEPSARLEEGIRRLQEMGYLQSHAELFVAQRVPVDAGSLRTALVVGVWIGSIGGALLGLLMTATAVLADTTLLDRPADLGWLALQFVGVAAVGASLALTLLLWPVLAWMQSHSGAMSHWAPLIPSALLGLYVSDASGRHVLPRLDSVQWPAASLVTAVCAGGAGWLLWRFLRAMVAAARVRLRGAPKIRARRRGDVWFAPLLAGVLGLVLLIVGPYREHRPLPRLDQIQVRSASPGPPTLIVAIEGLDRADRERLAGWSTAGRWWSSGAVTTLPSAAGHPASFWNEVATGFDAHVHGLGSATASAPRGVQTNPEGLRQNPWVDTVLRNLLPGIGLATVEAADQRELRRPPVWEMATRAGVRCRVVNWWATYPAAQQPPLEVVSDRWFLRLWENRSLAQSDSLLRTPDALEQEFERTGRGILQEVFRRRARSPFAARGDSILSAFETENAFVDDLAATWSYATASDVFHSGLTSPPAAGNVRLVAAHWNGLDVFKRGLVRVAESGQTSVVRVGAELLDLYLRLLDELLVQFVERSEADVTLLASSPSDVGRELWAWERMQGREAGVSLRATQWAPAVLERLGLPVARDMDAATVDSGLATYGRRPRWTPLVERSQRDLERLRSLGYIGP